MNYFLLKASACSPFYLNSKEQFSASCSEQAAQIADSARCVWCLSNAKWVPKTAILFFIKVMYNKMESLKTSEKKLVKIKVVDGNIK